MTRSPFGVRTRARAAVRRPGKGHPTDAFSNEAHGADYRSPRGGDRSPSIARRLGYLVAGGIWSFLSWLLGLSSFGDLASTCGTKLTRVERSFRDPRIRSGAFVLCSLLGCLFASTSFAAFWSLAIAILYYVLDADLKREERDQFHDELLCATHPDPKAPEAASQPYCAPLASSMESAMRNLPAWLSRPEYIRTDWAHPSIETVWSAHEGLFREFAGRAIAKSLVESFGSLSTERARVSLQSLRMGAAPLLTGVRVARSSEFEHTIDCEFELGSLGKGPEASLLLRLSSFLSIPLHVTSVLLRGNIRLTVRREAAALHRVLVLAEMSECPKLDCAIHVFNQVDVSLTVFGESLTDYLAERLFGRFRVASKERSFSYDADSDLDDAIGLVLSDYMIMMRLRKQSIPEKASGADVLRAHCEADHNGTAAIVQHFGPDIYVRDAQDHAEAAAERLKEHLARLSDSTQAGR